MTKGEREVEELEEEEEEPEGEEGGGGRGMVVTSWRERESITETEEPEAKARRPEGLRSPDPKLFRLGGPGSMQSQDSLGKGRWMGSDIFRKMESECGFYFYFFGSNLRCFLFKGKTLTF